MNDLVPTTETRPWDRMPGETDDRWEAFNQYLTIPKRGKGIEQRRFVADVRDLRGLKNIQWVAKVARAFKWEERAAAYDAFIGFQPQESAALAARKRQAQLDRSEGKKLRAHGIAAILKAKPEEIALKDAVNIVKLGIQLQERADIAEKPVTKQEEDELNAGIKQLVAELTRGMGDMASGGEGVAIQATERTVSFNLPKRGRGRPKQVREVQELPGEVLEGDFEPQSDG